MTGIEETSSALREISDAESKKILLDMMQHVHEFCEENGIRYFMYFGSLLGAIRHKGFIPWDDDMDICMTRKEYERFIKCFPRDKDTRYSVEICGDENHYVPFAKIVDNRTCLIGEGRIPTSMYIDLFIIDNEGESLFSAKLFMHFVSFIMRFRVMFSNGSEKWPFYKKAIFKIIKMLSLIVDERKLLIFIDKISKIKKSDKISAYAGSVNASCYNERQILRGEWFIEGMPASFEDRKFMIPVEYDKILKTVYVNYMDLPAVEARRRHHTECKRCWKE